MLLRQLEYLSALSREGHFGRAAEVCHVSQPALSAGIRKLEAELGVQIVQRGQRFEGFTPEGKEVLQWAHRMLAEQGALRHTLASMRGGLAGVLRIGAVPTALTIASLLTAPLREKHERVRFSLESMSSREIVSRLNDFEIDAGMTYVDGEPLGKVRVVPLYRERYVFLTPLDGRFGGRDEIGWAEAALAPLCMLTPVMQNRRILDACFAEAGALVSPVVETDTVEAIYAHVTSMRLSSVIPHAWLHNYGVPDGTRVLPLPRPTGSCHVGLVLADRAPESMLARALVETAREVDLHGALDETLRRHLSPSA
ncbi:LysR family transcriptional regulator [Streptomyces cavernicola]|uniref:LysR family transcriptional regulator n=1 Tax=Streptomyces cavernicola TaxID=3043613 RepID=A0ABT6SFT2_9ACTN|nr:LysR family transcriptional regulator [Streptomyces sp. B-S-A6]MDI3407020.1 LysR family transcriptional regulator [Streptomyces sp. B-S-A6]